LLFGESNGYVDRGRIGCYKSWKGEQALERTEDEVTGGGETMVPGLHRIL